MTLARGIGYLGLVGSALLILFVSSFSRGGF